MKLPPITIPVGWNERKDCEYFEERWSPKPSYTEALWYWMRFHYRHFDQALNRALRYLHGLDATQVWIEPSCLSAIEKIEILLEIARTSSVVAVYRSRLLENLHDCQFAEEERRRVVREHRQTGEQAWLYPIIEAIDYIGDAAFSLRETMLCENDDYRRLDAFGRNEEDQDCSPE